MRCMFVLALLCASAVACGNDDVPATRVQERQPTPSATGATTELEPSRGSVPSSKNDFIGAENEICRDYARRSEELGDPDAGEVAPWLREFITMLSDIQRRSRALQPPTDARADFDRYLAQNDAQLEALAKALVRIDAAEPRGDNRAVGQALREGFAEFDRIAVEQDPWPRRYGLTDCVDPTPPDSVSA